MLCVSFRSFSIENQGSVKVSVSGTCVEEVSGLLNHDMADIFSWPPAPPPPQKAF